MLVCFGISWPISLINNIKAKTAKSMNIKFTLLIIVGYIAGLTAKILSGQFTFVFAVYIFNLFVVSLNLVVFFINRNYDKHPEKRERKKINKVSV